MLGWYRCSSNSAKTFVVWFPGRQPAAALTCSGSWDKIRQRDIDVRTDWSAGCLYQRRSWYGLLVYLLRRSQVWKGCGDNLRLVVQRRG